MGYYFLPLDWDTYYAPNIQGDIGPCTYVQGGRKHGPGRLDMAFNKTGEPIYSMTDGVVTGKGIYDNGIDSYLHIQTSDSILGEFTIRYLHSDYDEVSVGMEVKKGDPIGTVGAHTTGDPHLHIDFQIDPFNADDSTFLGTLDYNNRTFSLNNAVYSLDSDIDLSLIKKWNQQRGDAATNTSIGYCWLVFAQTPKWIAPTIGPDDGIKIDRTIYDNHPGNPGHDNLDGVNAYFNAIFTEDFIGPPPKTWNDFLNNWNLRCLVSFIRHETGALIHSNRWVFASAITAKIMRATVLCHKGVNEVWGASYNTNNFQDWILTGAGGATDMGKYDGYGTTSDHRWRAWIGSQYINAGKYLVTEDPNGYNNILNKDDLPWITAVYNNFRYPDIYGASLEPNIDINFKQVLLDFCNGLVTDNYYLDGQYGYPVSDMAFKAEYHDGNMIFVGYRHKSDNSGITGSYNTYAYTLP